MECGRRLEEAAELHARARLYGEVIELITTLLSGPGAKAKPKAAADGFRCKRLLSFCSNKNGYPAKRFRDHCDH